MTEISLRTQTRRISRLIVLAVAVLLVLGQLLSLGSNSASPIKRMEFFTRDFAFQLRGPRPPVAPVVIIAIDDFSFNWTGFGWPWPRAYLAKMVDKLNQAGARLVGLDIFLFDPASDTGGDTALAAALAQSQNSASVMQIFRDSAQHTTTLNLPLPIYQNVLSGIGITPVLPDEDARVRKVQASDQYLDQTYSHWAFEIARLYGQTDFSQVPYLPGSDGAQNLLVNFAGPTGTFPTYQAAKLVEGDYDPALFKDKIVLIGATSATLHDLYPTPYSLDMPGVEIVANTIDTLISQEYIHLAPPWIGLLTILLMAGLAFLLLRQPTPTQTLLFMGIGLLAYAILWWAAFSFGNWQIPFAAPELMLFLGSVLPTVEQSITQELEKRRIRNLFGRFIAPEMVDQMVGTQDIQALNKRANLTILFSDIRSFTTLSESMQPTEIVSLLNPYLEKMSQVIYKHGGTIDKYEGDAILAFFGEPIPHADHAYRAICTALDMRVALAELKDEWRAEGREIADRFEIGIGLNTGDVFVGLLGSEQRVNYTVIGDVVNVAARLQDQTKVFKWPILISGETYQQVKDDFVLEFAGAPMLKGKTKPVNVYKVIGYQ